MKKNRINLKLKATSLAISLLSVFLFAVLSGTLLIKEASAIDYTSYSGTLEGADWALRIPDPWNGMLVMVCRGYSGSSLPSPFSTLGNVVASDILNQGFAVAASNYGTTGLCIPEGVNSTYQLTMHVIDNYNVTGRVFLLGMSMGGAIVLLLGEKYPEVYSGVLDDFGVKDMADLYTISKKWSNLTDEDLTAELTALNINRIPPDFFSTLDQFRNFLEMASNDTEIAMGGTPETHLQAYQDVSPTSHANITIPVITVHGTDDGMVPYYQSLMYQNAVADAGCSDMYRLVAVPGGGHGGLFGVSSETIVHFSELVEWSNYLTGVYDWPMFGHDPQNVGYTESPAPSTNQTLWTTTFSLGGGVSPVIAEDKLYFGAWNNKVYCLNYSTGAEIWNYTTGDPILCTAAVADGKVYVGSIDDNLYCLNASSGAKIWNFTGDGWGFRGAPTVVDGKVYAGSDDTNIYCLNATTGAKIWNYTTGDVLITFPAVADGKVYAGSNDTNVYCLDTLTGAKIWNYTTGDHVLSGPTIADGKVYVGSYDSHVYCLNATTGAQIWNCTTGGAIFTSPTIAYGRVYVGSFDDNVYCLNVSTGVPIWTYATDGNIFGAPAVADGKVYVGSADTNVYCLNATYGTLIWSCETSGVSYHGPAIANGVVYVLGGNQVYAFSDLDTFIPESFTIAIVVLLSTVAIILSFWLLRKQPKWKNMLLEKP
jgi:outer membrane protein assembly factor BamB/pimeloyl-ACP methyl ester carboxylesterase